MCGIAGLFSFHKDITTDAGEVRITAMNDVLTHRGPDGHGVWSDASSGVFLGHRRLAILDLSDTGAQPMTSSNDRYVMTYNGEIYNALDIRKELQSAGLNFKGTSDTEILLEALSAWGVDKTLETIKGMFAIALWDKHDESLTLIRDHIGKKPLYYGVIDNTLYFASELKAIKAAGATLNINRDALKTYTGFGFIPSGDSIYQHIQKLEPGARVTFYGEQNRKSKFWDMTQIAAQEKTTLSQEEQLTELKALLKQSVQNRLNADVPLGAFLSGGIDSSLVVSMMQELSDKPVKTFSAGFHEGEFDESVRAAKIAEHLGTDHQTFMVEEKDALDMIPKLPDIYDEPFADYSQIPTTLISKLAGQHTKVALTGDGGDESFCGYSRYFMGASLLRQTRKVPKPLRAALSAMLLRTPEHMLDKAAPHVQKLTAFPLNGKRLHSIAKFMRANNAADMAQAIMKITDAFEADLPLPDLPECGDIETMMLIDMIYYLPDDVLTKTDRASMAYSLELRSPLLDKDVIEFAWTLPLENKMFIDHKRGKWHLYNLLTDYVPEELVNYPKQGFTVPIAKWLRGELKDWAHELLKIDTGLYDRKQVQKLWTGFQSNSHDHHHVLWAILMAQAWHQAHDRA